MNPRGARAARTVQAHCPRRPISLLDDGRGVSTTRPTAAADLELRACPSANVTGCRYVPLAIDEADIEDLLDVSRVVILNEQSVDADRKGSTAIDVLAERGCRDQLAGGRWICSWIDAIDRNDSVNGNERDGGDHQEATD